ncbi:uncharacterized protein LOC117644609 [Thrips palmi]|uniref:Uncharacterized protein LOC117644609 n=1 Tax=Thrips palmi TaxID=161013 RepID=A0A6P8YSQ3_THRPL|nr:uncharacterized protein LOC117644609 [Thrips palmi]XP_034240107.1 uncharacterized protein LOC117644609 [Thrips palmi]
MNDLDQTLDTVSQVIREFVKANDVALSHANIHENSDIDVIEEEYEYIQGDFKRLGFPSRSQTAMSDSSENESWDMMQDVELEDFDFAPSPPPNNLSEGELEDVMLNGGIFNWQQPSISSDIMDDESSDANELVVSRSGSSLSGDSDGSPSTISPIGLSPVYRGSPDSGSSRSDCENNPLIPSQSPCYSRPGSPWPMFARPSFKKTRSPFWTTFRVREFR